MKITTRSIRSAALAALVLGSTVLVGCGSAPDREVHDVRIIESHTTEAPKAETLDVNDVNPDSGITYGQQALIEIMTNDPSTAATLCQGVAVYGANEVARIFLSNAVDAGIQMPLSDVANVFTVMCE